jgi:hypothetical protein
MRVLQGDGAVQTKRLEALRERALGVRCPRCQGALVARVASGQRLNWCRCPVRRGLALGA